MEQAFDAYHKWLGIPPECQPPDRYRLLGLQAFESDPDVIQAAADQRMMHLRGYQTGKHSEWSQRLLNEVAGAKVCLLNAAKKAAYDQQLQTALGGSMAAAPELSPAEQVSDFAPSCAIDIDAVSSHPRRRSSASAARARRLPVGAMIAALAAMVALLLLIWIVYRTVDNTETPAVTSPPTNGTLAQPGNHGAATNHPQHGGTAGQPNQTTGKPPQSDRPSSVHPISTAGPLTEKHPQASPVSPNHEPPVDIFPEGSVPTPIESPSGSSNDTISAPELNREPDAPLPRLPSKEDTVASRDKRVAEPSVESQETAMKLAREVYKDDFTKAKTADAKRALAKKLFQQAEKAPNADADTFVLFRLARDTAAQALDGLAAFAAIDAVAERYQIDAMKMKLDLLVAFAKKSHLSAQHLAVAEQAAKLMMEAAAAEDFDRAADLARLTISEGGLGHDKDLVAQAKACLKTHQQQSALVKEFETAQATLVKAPDDAAANVTAGIYYGGLKDDWTKGLRCLAKGDDPVLKTLAERELKSPPLSADDQAALADAWWDASASAEGVTKAAMIHRTAFWCKKALGNKIGVLGKAKIEKRLDEIAKFEQSTGTAALASRPPVPINKWFPLLTSPNELVGWDTKNSQFSYVKGVIEVRSRNLYCPIIVKDVSIRAMVKCPPNGRAQLLVRNCDQGCYTARLSAGAISIVKQKRTRVKANGYPDAGEDVLTTIPLPRSKQRGDLLFEFGFSAVGDVLTAYVNRAAVAQAKDATFSQGSVGVGISGNGTTYVSSVTMLIHNKASFVADQRTPAADQPLPAKRP